VLIALTRAVPPTLAHCELTHLERQPIDFARAVAQHAGYEAALRALGARVERVAPAPELADSVFIEDAAVVFDELAVLMRPGAVSRRGEVDAVAVALARYRPIQSIADPATMDGGDVLQIGRRVFVGQSRRTNAAAIGQLTTLLQPHGYQVTGVPVEACLHLKSAVTAATEDLLILNPAWIDGTVFDGLRWIEIDPDEPAGANVLRVGDAVLCPASAPRTRARLEAHGLIVHSVDASELAKAEGALTCCSLIVSESAVAR
jgi:dimethylargininase